MSKQRKQRQAAKELRAAHRQQDDSTLPAPLPKEEPTQLIVVKTTFTFPDGTETGDYHIVKIPVSTTFEQYRQERLEYRRLDYPEAQLSIELYDIDDMPPDGSLPDGMTFRSARMFEAL
jgi:hypothetical protein